MLTVTEPQTYRKDHLSHQYFIDLALATLDENPDAVERLRRHAIDVESWDDDDRALAQIGPRPCESCGKPSGRAGQHVPPLWLLKEQLPELLNCRPYVNAIYPQPLPPGTDSINVPTRLGTPPRHPDPDWFINAPVRTIAGQQAIREKFLREPPLCFDMIVFRDLIDDYAINTSKAVITGTGARGEILGIHNTPRIGCNTHNKTDGDRALYNKISDAIGHINNHRYLPPTHIVMNPTRWPELEAQFDKHHTGRLHDLPVLTDEGMPNDLIHILRTNDLVMWESGLRARVLPNDDGKVGLQVYGYAAFTAGRYPSSIVEIECPTPTVN